MARPAPLGLVELAPPGRARALQRRSRTFAPLAPLAPIAREVGRDIARLLGPDREPRHRRVQARAHVVRRQQEPADPVAAQPVAGGGERRHVAQLDEVLVPPLHRRGRRLEPPRRDVLVALDAVGVARPRVRARSRRGSGCTGTPRRAAPRAPDRRPAPRPRRPERSPRRRRRWLVAARPARGPRASSEVHPAAPEASAASRASSGRARIGVSSAVRPRCSPCRAPCSAPSSRTGWPRRRAPRCPPRARAAAPAPRTPRGSSGGPSRPDRRAA